MHEKWTLENTRCETWFERDRQYVELLDSNDQSIFGLWDADVTEFVEDGWKLRNESWHSAMIDYANYAQLKAVPSDL